MTEAISKMQITFKYKALAQKVFFDKIRYLKDVFQTKSGDVYVKIGIGYKSDEILIVQTKGLFMGNWPEDFNFGFRHSFESFGDDKIHILEIHG